MLWVYFDESGRYKDQRLCAFAIGGALTTCDKWLQFESEWVGVLKDKDFKIDWFHMTDFVGGNCQFKGWSSAKKDQLFERLLILMDNFIETYVGAAVTIHEVEIDNARLQRKGRPQKTLNWFIPLYYERFRSCMRGAVQKCKDIDPKTQISMVFAKQPEIKIADLAKHFNDLKKHYGNRIGRFATGEPRTMMQLQASDIVAFSLAAESGYPKQIKYVEVALRHFRKKYAYFETGGKAKLHVLDKYDPPPES